jgi:hypothetical protein
MWGEKIRTRDGCYIIVNSCNLFNSGLGIKAQSWPHGFIYFNCQLSTLGIWKKNMIRTWIKDDQHWLVCSREFMQCFQSSLARLAFGFVN